MKKSYIDKLLSILEKEDIEKSMQFIDTNGIPKGRQSNTFDVVGNSGKNYPPPFLLETAYKQKTSEELPKGFFDNIGKNSPHFKIIEALGFKIMAKQVNNNSLEIYLKEFSKIADDWFTKQDWFEERFDFYKNFFKKENIESAEWKEFQEMGNYIHSFNSMAIAKGNALGNMNLPIEEYRRIFLYILSEEDPVNVTINNLYKKYNGNAFLPYFSDSSISELIAYAYPDKYVTYNRRDVKALEILGLKLKKVRAEKFGDLFLRYNNLLQPILEQYKKIVGKRTNATTQLELDQFFSWLYETKKADKPIKDLIYKYKERIKETKLKEEIYKWEFINNYKGRPNTSAENFQEEIKSIKWGNLIYGITGGVLNHIAREKDEELRDLFKGLFDDSVSLENRIKSWDKKMMATYRKVHGEHSHHQDERAISVYLTLQNPDRFTFYKSSYYTKFCELIGDKPKKKGFKYIHYMELINMLAKEYISKDQELIDLVLSYNQEYYDGVNHLLLAQDILFQVLDQPKEQNDSEINLKNDFKIWLEEKHQNSGTVSSYIKALENFSMIGGFEIFETVNVDLIMTWYEDALEHQSDLNGKYFIEESPSYGKNKFYSASLKKYVEFLNTRETMVNEESATYKSKGVNDIPLNQILYGPPGTGKTYNTILEAAKIITQDEGLSYDEGQSVFNNQLGERIEFITFHQNYSYEDFIQGLRPDTEVNGELSFFKSDGVFKKIADRALKNLKDSKNPQSAKKEFEQVFYQFIKPLNDGDEIELEIQMKQSSYYITEVGEKSIQFRKNRGESEHSLCINTLRKMYDKGSNDIILGGLQPYYNPILNILLINGKSDVEIVEKQNYVIIIDEINRANISRVFGELITLIEKDKRSHGKLPLTVTLPSGDKFTVPSNLYIIGTMNTADKSIALLDIALRRRFEFKAMYPKYEIPNSKVHYSDFLKKLNELIVKSGKGHDFTIGHSYFMDDEESSFDFKNTINTKVIPLMLEYYMNDENEVSKILKDAGVTIGNWPLELIVND